jgi:hypothetical protein
LEDAEVVIAFAEALKKNTHLKKLTWVMKTSPLILLSVYPLVRLRTIITGVVRRGMAGLALVALDALSALSAAPIVCFSSLSLPDVAHLPSMLLFPFARPPVCLSFHDSSAFHSAAHAPVCPSVIHYMTHLLFIPLRHSLKCISLGTVGAAAGAAAR